jgi:hypothetical protein
MCWESMIVFKLENKTTLSVSRIIAREQGKSNKEISRGKYEKDIVSRTYSWKGDEETDKPPLPTMLSTLVALTMCAPAPASDDLWILDTRTANLVPTNDNTTLLPAVTEEPLLSQQSRAVSQNGQKGDNTSNLGRGKTRDRPYILPTDCLSLESPTNGTATQQNFLQNCSSLTHYTTKHKQPVSLAKVATCRVNLIEVFSSRPNCYPVTSVCLMTALWSTSLLSDGIDTSQATSQTIWR